MSIKRKLRSEKGASITFALLLFLVCAVISSVVLVAATSSAGRMSQIAQTDQRYYSVTSATGLLKEVIEGNPVVVVNVTQTPTVATYTTADDGTESVAVTNGTVTNTTYYSSTKTADDIKTMSISDFDKTDSGMVKVTTDTTMTFDSIQAEAAVNYSKKTTITDQIITLSAAVANGLDVTIKENLSADGTLTLVVYNTTENDTDKRFTQTMVFKPDTEKKSFTSSEQKQEKSGTTVTITTTKIKKEITTTTWTLASVSTIGT